MKAQDLKNLSPSKQDEILKSPRYVAEVKFDGCRVKLHLGEEGNRLDSRHRSVKTYEYVEKTGTCPHFAKTRIRGLGGTILDGEILAPTTNIRIGKTQTEGLLTSTTSILNSSAERAIELQKQVGPLRLVLFDIPFLEGVDQRSLPFAERRRRLVRTFRILLDQGMEHIFLSETSPDPQALYQRVIAGHGEGIMLKHLDAPYASEGRKRYWLKWKKSSTIDAFVTGFVPGEGEFSGLVGALIVSAILPDGAKSEIGAVQPGDLALRREMSVGGELADTWYGRVLEVSFQEWTKNHRMRHAVLVRWRPDKNCWECKL